MEIALQRALLWIVLLPLFGAALNGLLGRRASRATVQSVAVGSVAGAFALAAAAFCYLASQRHLGLQGAALDLTVYRWFSLMVREVSVPIDVRLVMDSLSGVMTLVVTGVSLLIHIYACGYVTNEPSYARFFSYLNLFTASMLLLVLASNFPLMFVGWEGVGLCSYLLIGFWFETPAFASAGRKAFVTNRIGDFGVLIGMLILVRATGSFEFEKINHSLTAVTTQYVFTFGAMGMTAATAATLCLFLGCTGKSAQIPLFVWLPEAVAAPTPVSALIYAAAIVTSGVYLICRLSSVFAVAPCSMALVASVGTLTALMAASIALVQVDIKRILAYSTVSQLGVMFAGVGCGAFAAGFFHLFTHVFFNACLFLGAGSVMHAIGARGDADIRTLGGLRKYLPRTHGVFLVSCVAIAGVPFFSGFFSENKILIGALSVHPFFWFAPWLGTALFVLLAAVATMTAFYAFRLYFTAFWGEYRGGPAAAREARTHGPRPRGYLEEGDFQTPHESPGSMTWPLMLLGVGAGCAGYLWVGVARFEPWVEWLRPALGDIGVGASSSAVNKAAIGGMVAAALGIGVAWAWYGKPRVETPGRLSDQLPDVYGFLRDRWRFDEFYEATVLRLSRGLALVSAGFDKTIVDGLLADLPVYGVRSLRHLFTRFQNRVIQHYGTLMAAGLMLVMSWYIIPHARLEAPNRDRFLGANPIHLAAAPGLGYQYRWDFDSDGRYETDWQTQPVLSHQYKNERFEPGPVVLLKEAGYRGQIESIRLHPGETLDLDTKRLGRWRSEDFRIPRRLPELVGAPARIVADENGLGIRPNGARVTKAGQRANPTEEVRVGPGETVHIGEAELIVAGAVRTTVLVKSAFGIQTKDSIQVTLTRSRATGKPQALPGGVQ
jgi:NADH-quinone oxidoreductase subunit L